MTIRSIDPQQAKRLVDEGALLVDVREPDEHARERIHGARLAPLSRLSTPLVRQDGQPVVFHCRSGSRTAAAIEQLAAAADGDGYILRGGMAAWKALPERLALVGWPDFLRLRPGIKRLRPDRTFQ